MELATRRPFVPQGVPTVSKPFELIASKTVRPPCVGGPMTDWLADDKNDRVFSAPVRACLAGAGVYSANLQRTLNAKDSCELASHGESVSMANYRSKT